MDKLFAKFPTWWVVQGIAEPSTGEVVPGLTLFPYKTCGVSTAALQLYIVLLSETNNDEASPSYGTVQISINDIENLTAMSRSAIVSGSERLESLGLVNVVRKKGVSNIYQIIGYDRTPWGKLPAERFKADYVNGRTLRHISLRGKANLNALRLYLFIAASRDKKTGGACRTYHTITKQTGIRRNDIVAARSMLINLQLITIKHEEPSIKGEAYKLPLTYYPCDLK